MASHLPVFSVLPINLQPHLVTGQKSDLFSDEDSVFNDNLSVISNASDGSYFRDEVIAGGGANSDEAEELNSEDVLEEKMRDSLELATDKSAKNRVTGINNLRMAFLRNLVPDFIEDR